MAVQMHFKHFLRLKTVIIIYSCLSFVVTPTVSWAQSFVCQKIYDRTTLQDGLRQGQSTLSPLVSYFESLNLQPTRGDYETFRLPLIKDLPQELRTDLQDDKSAVGYISYQFADIRNTELDIGLVSVYRAYRGQGVADFLYRKILEKNPQVQSISCTLADTNLEVVVNVLIQSLASHRLFNQRALDQYKRDVEKEYRTSNRNNKIIYQSEDMFAACCSMIPLRDYPQGLVEKAIRTSPSFRATSKLGFNKIKEIKFNPVSLNTYDVEFTVLRGH